MEDNIEKLRYPVGKYLPETPITMSHIAQWKKTIAEFPAVLKGAIENFSEADFQKTYRPGGWTGLQVIHHVADSHINSYTRFKLGLTEDHPVIKPYREDLWAELYDGKSLPPAVSLNIIEAIHYRWSVVLEHFKEEDWKRTVRHPEYNKDMTLAYLLGMYDWHCRHHLGHIKIIASGIS